MPHRPWTKQSVGGKRWAYVIACKRCGKTDEVGSQMGQDLAASKVPVTFARHGWQVGKRAGDDYCYNCVQKFKAINHKAKEQEMAPATVTPIRAEPPAELSRQDRRVIWAKLEEVYMDESTGYQKGWDDAAVAKDLGVEQAWVAEVREANFGPEKSEDFSRIIQDGTEMVAEGRQLLAQFKGAQELFQAIARNSGKLDLRLSHLERELDDLKKRSQPRTKIKS